MTKTSVEVRRPEMEESATVVTRPEWWENPLVELRQDIDQLFDFLSWDFPFKLGWPERRLAARRDGAGPAAMPRFDVAEADGAYTVTAEVPGLAEDDLDITLADGVLTIRGEIKNQREEQNKDYVLRERRYGAFSRSLRVPDTVDLDHIKADLKKGLLTITLPKTAEARKRERKIRVKAA